MTFNYLSKINKTSIKAVKQAITSGILPIKISILTRHTICESLVKIKPLKHECFSIMYENSLFFVELMPI